VATAHSFYGGAIWKKGKHGSALPQGRGILLGTKNMVACERVANDHRDPAMLSGNKPGGGAGVQNGKVLGGCLGVGWGGWGFG